MCPPRVSRRASGVTHCPQCDIQGLWETSPAHLPHVYTARVGTLDGELGEDEDLVREMRFANY